MSAAQETSPASADASASRADLAALGDIPRARIIEDDEWSSSSGASSRAPSVTADGDRTPSMAGEEEDASVSFERVDAEDGKRPGPKLSRLFSASQMTSLTSPTIHSAMAADYKTQIYLNQEAKKHNEKKAQEAARRKQQREKLAAEAISIWEKDIIPQWDAKHQSKQARQMFKLGIPAKVRGNVWKLAVGNQLSVTPELFDICQRRARNALELTLTKDKRRGSGDRGHQLEDSLVLGREDTVKLIQMDLARTFPSLGLFQPGAPMHGSLKEVLQAYVCYRPDIGYVQGMSFLAAMLLINLEPYDAFQVLANMLNRGCHMAFFTMDLPRIEGYKAAFDELFAELLPELSRHFREQHVPTDMYLLDWLMTLFSKSLPLELAMRIWDRYFLYGEIFLFRCAFAILHMMKLRLLSQQFDGIAYDLTHLPIIYDEDQFFSHVKAVKIPPKRFAAVVSAHVAPRK